MSEKVQALAALKQLVARAPDATLGRLAAAIESDEALLKGQVGDIMRKLIVAERADRSLELQAFAPILPLCAQLPERLVSARLSRAALRGLWWEVRQATPALVEQAERARAAMEPGDPTPTVFDSLCETAGRIGLGDSDRLSAQLGLSPREVSEAALWIMLTPLARRLLTRLRDFLGRSDEEKAAALRVMFRDATVVAPDAAPRLLELALAHVAEPELVLRVISQLTDRATDRYLADSELATFGERILEALERSIEAVRRFSPEEGVAAAVESARAVARAAEMAGEFDRCVDLTKDGPWGRRLADIRRRMAEIVEGRLREIDAALTAALPWRKTRVVGRMTRPAPRVDQPLNREFANRLLALATFMDRTRSVAANAGFGALRNALAESAATQLETYADELLHLINAGEAEDREGAFAYLEVAAEALGLLRGPDAARIVRRRAAAAGDFNASKEVA